jgi:ABC-type multidrug transport system fused ATPase/permease subunit
MLVGCIVMMVFTAISGLAIYFISYQLITKYQSDDLKDPTSNLFRVVGMLLSLMLSLTFGDVVIELVQIRNAVERETSAISDVYNDLELFDIERTRNIRNILIDYIQAVIDDDWPALGEDKLGQHTDKLERQLSEAVIKLKPTTPIQEKLWSRIMADVDLMSDYRLNRLNNALVKPPVYLFVIILGFFVTMACFGAYRPQAPLVGLVLIYTLFIGLVLFLVLTLSDPFQGIGVQPTSFKHLNEKLQSKI